MSTACFQLYLLLPWEPYNKTNGPFIPEKPNNYQRISNERPDNKNHRDNKNHIQPMVTSTCFYVGCNMSSSFFNMWNTSLYIGLVFYLNPNKGILGYTSLRV